MIAGPVVMVAPHARRYGGAEVHLLALTRWLARSGVAVTVLHRSPGRVDVPGVEFIHCGTDRDVQLALATMPDATVHVHDDALSEGALRTLRANRPVVRSLHNTSFACASGTHLLSGSPCPRAHGPLCLAHVATRRCVEQRNPLPALRRWGELGESLEGAREDRATIFYSDYARSIGIRNGLRPERSHELHYFVERGAEPVAVPGDGIVCFVGRLTKLKGVDVLLSAVARTPAVRRLEIVGDGYHRRALGARVDRLGLTGRVRFHGWLSERDTKAVMVASDIVAVPSTWPEPFGIVGLEAMNAGRPTVASAIGGIPEWLRDGEVGRLVAPSRPQALAGVLAELLSSHDTLALMGEAAWKRVALYSPQAHVAGLERVYRTAHA